MNKAEQREIQKLATYVEMGMLDTVARSLSAMIRASMTNRSRVALLAHAEQFGVIGHPEFII